MACDGQQRLTLSLLSFVANAVSSETADKSFGPGASAGSVPTDIEQSTGLERDELLAKLEGRELFDIQPLEMTHLGTPKNPIVVKSHDAIRFVGCTGKPTCQWIFKGLCAQRYLVV
jgi:cytochrome c oxidase subunit 5b